VRSSRRPLIVAIALAAVVVIVAGLGAFVAFGPGSGGGKNGRPGGAGGDPTRKEAYALLVEGAGALLASSAQHYTGTVTARSGDPVRVDGRVTDAGTTAIAIDVAGGHGELLDLGDNGTYARGDSAFWSAARTPGSTVAFGSSWVRVDFDSLGFDPRLLIPDVLVAGLLPATEEDEAEPAADALPHLGDVRTIAGGEAREIRTATERVWVSTSKPARIVRVEGDAADRASSGPSLRSSRLGAGGAFVPARRAPGAGLSLDLAALTPAELDDSYKTVKARVAELVDATDSQVSFNVDGQVKVGPCGQTSCTAVVALSNTVTVRSPYIHPVGQVNAAVTIDMTLDDRPIKTCTSTVSMPPNGTGSAQCTATYTLPRSTTARTFYIEARARTSARALVQADVQRMVEDIAKEEAAKRSTAAPSTAPSAAGPSSAPSGAASVSAGPSAAPPCAEPTGAAGGPGQWRPFDRNAAKDWVTYQEQVSGVKRGREYRLGDRDFDGYQREAGTDVLLEAKGRGNAWLLWGLRVGDGGKLTFVDDTDESDAAVEWGDRARKKLDALLRQMRGQLAEVGRVPGARLRFVAAEQALVDKFQAYARTQLTAEEFARVEWKHVPVDRAFGGCV
jgi:hypothetical protein